MKFHKTYTELPTLKEGEKYFCARYDSGYGFGYRTVLAAKTKEDARAFFNKFYNAKLVRITEGTY